MREIKFRGRSGKAYSFVRMAPTAPWAREAGVALFAAQGPFGWRVVRLTTLRGRLHDVQPIWAWADAERYGARTVFHPTRNGSERTVRLHLADLEAGLNPGARSTRKMTMPLSPLNFPAAHAYQASISSLDKGQMDAGLVAIKCALESRFLNNAFS